MEHVLFGAQEIKLGDSRGRTRRCYDGILVEAGAVADLGRTPELGWLLGIYAVQLRRLPEVDGSSRRWRGDVRCRAGVCARSRHSDALESGIPLPALSLSLSCRVVSPSRVSVIPVAFLCPDDII